VGLYPIASFPEYCGAKAAVGWHVGKFHAARS